MAVVAVFAERRKSRCIFCLLFHSFGQKLFRVFVIVTGIRPQAPRTNICDVFCFVLYTKYFLFIYLYIILRISNL